MTQAPRAALWMEGNRNQGTRTDPTSAGRGAEVGSDARLGPTRVEVGWGGPGRPGLVWFTTTKAGAYSRQGPQAPGCGTYVTQIAVILPLNCLGQMMT